MKKYTIDKDFIVNGLRCVIITTSMGYHCGYVGIPKEHPFFGLSYDSPIPTNFIEYYNYIQEKELGDRDIINIFCHRHDSPKLDILFDVHGSLTYSGGNNYPVESDLWWFGYDCGHISDLLPNLNFSHGVYRDLNYNIDQCTKLAYQLSTITWE